MSFYEVIEEVIALLQRHGRVSYRALKRQFALDDELLADLKAELRYAHYPVVEDGDQGLVWTGETGASAAEPPPPPRPETEYVPHAAQPPAKPRPPDAERRQLTVLFCDLVDSTVLASQLDPEEWREVVRAYQDTCAKVIARYEGHIAQYLGDGLLVYFGYPRAHEDDAQRAVRVGLGIVEAVGQLNVRLTRERGVSLGVRLGCHTGLVVVGEVGGETRQEQLALGETPNVAARLQGIAAPNTLVVSAATLQLLGGFFTYQLLGTSVLKGLAQPVEVYQVLHESTARSRLEAARSTGLTPLVGREQEVALLRERWVQVKDGMGQVVLLSGEAGIGKSRLVQVLTEQVAAEPQAWLTPCQCSPYYQNSALYPLVDLLERVVLQFDRDETPPQKLRKLEGFLVQYGLPLAEAVPLLAALLSLPLTADYAPLTVSPEQQKQKTLQTLLTILLRIAVQQPVLFVMEDLHWVDPTTLEFLSLLVDQGPTARILTLLTFRPDFSPPWTGRAHLTQVTLNRLPRRQAAELTGRVAHGKALPAEVVEHVVAKTDGVPLFVEELTKMVLESGLLQEREARYELTGPLPPLAIPTTLHDSLMARLDRLAAVKGLAQLGATLGREFSYELLQAVSPWDEDTLQRGLHQLVAAEFLYQQGLPPQATYRFKHALIQEAAYQSLLKSTRQQYHQQIAQVLAVHFPEIAESQPELLAHHYTEASLVEPAVLSWLRAGRRAVQRSANVEAIRHFTQGLDILRHCPATPECIQHELSLQLAISVPLKMLQGHTAPEVAQVQRRAYALCQQVGDSPQRFSALVGLWGLSLDQAQYQMARELGEQCFALAQRLHDPLFLHDAHLTLGAALVYPGELVEAYAHIEQAIALHDPRKSRSLALGHPADSGVMSLAYASRTLWLLGYPEQALTRINEACTLAQELSHAYSLGFAWQFAATLHQYRREPQRVWEYAEAAMAFAEERGFVRWSAASMMNRGWALVEQGLAADGVAQIQQGLSLWRSMGGELGLPYYLAKLAEAYKLAGQAAAGLQVVAEALALVQKNAERYSEAELYRLQGDLLLALARTEDQGHSPRTGEAETCFQQALEVARRQHAKSWELRAAVSLGRLWQQQGQRAEAYELLAPIYGWFTEGFDAADLQEAKGLLDELS
jgi:class 3 adenylate cyclase/predicted ATPase